MWTLLAGLALAAPCEPDVEELQQALDVLPASMRSELSAMWLAESCPGRPGLSGAARMIAQSPPEYRPMVDLKAILDEPALWIRACAGGLAVPQEMAQVAPADKRRVIWEGCELADKDWFTRAEWDGASGLIGIAFTGAQAVADSGASTAEVRVVARGLAGIGGGSSGAPTGREELVPPPLLLPAEAFEPTEGRAPGPELGGGSLSGFGGAMEDSSPTRAGFVERPEVRWTGAAKRSETRVCRVEVTVRKTGEFGRVEWIDCPEALRKPVEKALASASYTTALDGGVAVKGTFRTRFTVR